MPPMTIIKIIRGIQIQVMLVREQQVLVKRDFIPMIMIRRKYHMKLMERQMESKQLLISDRLFR